MKRATTVGGPTPGAPKMSRRAAPARARPSGFPDQASDCIGLPSHDDICCRVSGATGGPGSDSEHFRFPQGPAQPFGGTLTKLPRARAQQRGDLAIAIAAVLPGKLDNIGGETPLVITTARDLALRRAMLPERRTGATLGNCSCARTCSMQARRRAGLRSFPGRPPAE